MDGPINELATALAKAQGEMLPAKQSGYNPHFKNNYATITDCWDVIRVPFAKYGLSVSQPTVVIDGKAYLRTVLLHSSGQTLSSDFPLPAANNIQGTGSAISYARRYCLKSLVGIADSEGEDDGEASSNDGKEKARDGGSTRTYSRGDGDPGVGANNPPSSGGRPPAAPPAKAPEVDPTAMLTEKQANDLVAKATAKGLNKDGFALALREYGVTDPKSLMYSQGQKLWNYLETLPYAVVAKKLVTEKQLTRLWTIAHAKGCTNEEVHLAIKEDYNLDSAKGLDWIQYDAIVKEIEATKL